MKNGLDEQYIGLLKDILENGVEKNTRNGKTLSVFGRSIRYKFKDGKFPLLTTKKMPFKTIVTELLWFLRGDTNIKFLVDNNCHIWDGDAYNYYVKNFKPEKLPNYFDVNPQSLLPLSMEDFIDKIKTDDEFAKKWGELGPIYGAQWRGKLKGYGFNEVTGESLIHGIDPKFDQIINLINELKNNPDSRRLMVNAWNVADVNNGSMVLPPCHYGFQVYTRELTDKERIELAGGKIQEKYPALVEQSLRVCDERNIPTRAISLMWNQRSCDTFLGIPFNIASYGLLLVIIAKSVNMIPDELIGNLGDVHLYSNHIEQAKEQIRREPYPLPKLNINTEFWPTEKGSCGEGPLDALAVFNSFFDKNFCRSLLEEDSQLSNYVYHPKIKAPLSN